MNSDIIPDGLAVRLARPRPVVVQTAKATTDNLPLIAEWIIVNGHAATLGEGQLTIQTLEGPFTVRPGDQVVREAHGGFQRHEGGEIFETVYEDLGWAV